MIARPTRSGGIVIALVVLFGLAAGVRQAAAAPVAESASCTAGSTTWRVDFTVSDSVYGPLARVTGLRRITAAGDTDASGQTWELRWDNLPDEFPPAAAAEPGPFHFERGTLGTLGTRSIAAYLSPRLVAPDGSCQVYLAPFGNRRTDPAWPRVAVLGDSLLQQLNDSDYNAANGIQGYVEGNLNGAQIMTEVEGQGGRRWTDNGATGLAKADGYLLDEFRGLLEQDPNGFVTALGANDALYIATGGTPEAREARRREVADKLIAVVGEMAARTPCLVVLTAPQHGNIYSPDYAAAAQSVNDVLRFLAAADTGDSLTVIDFADQARTHQNTDAEPWFGSDNLHLNTAGELVYTATVTEAARRCTGTDPSRTVTVYGKSGTFGALGTVTGQTPSGQPLRTAAVPGWEPPAGLQAFFGAVAGDGTVFAAGLDHNGAFFFPTAEESVVLSYDPARRTYRNIKLRTTAGTTTMTKPDGGTLGAAVADLQTIDGGRAVAFTTFAPPEDPATGAQWPSFGVLTKAGGQWQVAAGNQWTGRQLRESNPADGPRACPWASGSTDHTICRGLNEMALFPASKDIIVAQYTQGEGDENKNGALVVLRVEGPDAQGRYTARIRSHYQIPRFRNPQTADPDDWAEVSVRNVETDSTGVRGDERFAIAFDAWNVHGALIEFSYNADTGAIRPVSAPLVPGDRRSDGTFWGFNGGFYDSQGNVWSPRAAGFPNGPLGVFARTPGARNIGGPACAYDPSKTLDQYTTTTIDGRTVWGMTCPPDYDILQGETVTGTYGLTTDPRSRTVMVVGLDASVLPIRSSGSGASMTFEVGNLVTVGANLTPTAANPVDPARKAFKVSTQGGFDAAGRYWFWMPQSIPPSCAIDITRPAQCMWDNQRVTADQWLASVDVSELFAPAPVVLPNVPGWAAEVQAEHTSTIATQRSGRLVDSAAFVRTCTADCADDAIPGNGYVLADNSGFGVPSGSSAEYRVKVSSAGEYAVSYRTAIFPNLPNGRINLTVAGTTYSTLVPAGNPWAQVVNGPVVTLPAGTHTIRVSAPADGGGWYLNRLTLTRR